ncbi:hypothetical protein [Janibacter sp. GS2]|uniref:hypothetical protein n=1 Tax=Janibacter sp. GS2 TaxID=3442646 RepID=UPI003EBDCDEB
MSESTTLVLFTSDGKKADTITTALPAEVTLLRARGYQTQEQYTALQKAKAEKAEKAEAEKAAAEKAAAEKAAAEKAEKAENAEKGKSVRSSR